MTAPAAREPVPEAVRRRLAADPSASVEVLAADAGISRATFYRRYGTRNELLERLAIEPDPDTRQRILAAAVQLIERTGLRGLSMDELAEAAGVSRASVYRLFPGKAALFEALLATSSPFDEVGQTVHRLRARPPEEVLPEVLGAIARLGAPRTAIMRSLMLEVSLATPEATEAAAWAIRPMLVEVAGYLEAQMRAGRIRRLHPLLAAQALVGPLVYHLLTRPLARTMGDLDSDPVAVADELSRVALRGLVS